MVISLGLAKPLLANASNALDVFTNDNVSEEESSLVMFVPDSTEVLQLLFSMQRKDFEFSGLLIEKNDSGKLLGAIMNDFGVRAFNFTYDKNTGFLEINDMAMFLDKFYIRPALKSIIRRLLTLKRNEMNVEVDHCIGNCSADGNELTLSEPRYDLLITISRIQADNKEEN